MKIRKAVITAAGRSQRSLPLQTLIDRDGVEKHVLRIIVEEALRADVEEIAMVVSPGDEAAYARVAGDHAGRLLFIPQPEPLGYGHAVLCARAFVGQEPFLHLVGDHLYISRTDKGCAQRLVEVATAQACAVSAVQATRENQLTRFGAVGGQRVAGSPDLYRVETVIEKPTPTEAEQRLVVPGMRAGHYLCFFGMHVLTPTVMEFLGPGRGLSDALAEVARREQYLALEFQDRRYDIGVRYGVLNAQLALALSGCQRDEVLSQLLELLAMRDLTAMGR
jgi:UTP--glucose-1-phosphate uridylyltransferase